MTATASRSFPKPGILPRAAGKLSLGSRYLFSCSSQDERVRRPISVKSVAPETSGNFRPSVLAFEDTYDIEYILKGGGVDLDHMQFVQRWTTDNAVADIREYKPDVLLLDFYIPPYTGLEVLTALNKAVKKGELKRPTFVIGMSSVNYCNRQLVDHGADAGFLKWDVTDWKGWRSLQTLTKSQQIQ
eukprot:CAMPEP_0114326318 /NCGR_PEP_ID=MMETSP0059-20121206/29656_1 /TAXON_ID=36894 /ORGANISM="Pyramimonas parkeae, Strain CCMP726" /LENGTH=185 /DNA_ID=CAMNT_0001455275 /DNA_START=69 /DNA_END=626 /DNA_ORIENTATION=-